MGSGSDLGFCANLVRVVLIIINALFGVLGIVVFAIGIWAIVQDQNYSFVTGNAIVSGAGILIAAGIVSIMICAVGILGAIFKLRPLLVVYALVVLIIVILEIVAGIVAFVLRDDLIEVVGDRSLEALGLYRLAGENGTQEDVNDFVEFIQDSFSCCGVTNASDWFRQNPKAVMATDGFPGCTVCSPTGPTDENCVPFFNETFTNSPFYTTPVGCLTGSSDRLTVFAYSVGGVGIAFGILQILGILLSLLLCCCINAARKQEVV